MTTTTEESSNHYQVLGVGTRASDNEIRKAYLQLSKKYHPDKHHEDNKKEATELFQRLNNAYQVLKDPTEREKYDAELTRSKATRTSMNSQQSTQRGPFSWTPPNKQQHRQEGQQKTHYEPRSKASARPPSPKPRPSSHRARPSSKRPKASSRQRPSAGSSPYAHAKQQSRPEQGHRDRAESHDHSRNTKRDDSRRSTKQTAFGKCQDGEPCKRCIRQGGFCYQHEHQNPNHCARQPRTKSSQGRRQESNSKVHEHVFGLRKDGEPCKKCSKKGDFCHHHDHQRSGTASRRTKENRRQYCGQVFGVRLDGQPCLRCTKMKCYCYQHLNQQAYHRW